MYITHSPSSVETKWQDLREGIFKAMSHDIPTKWSSNRSHLPWLSSKLKKCIRKKHKLMQLAKKIGIPSDWSKYKQHKSITPKQVRQAHWNYVNAILNKSLEHGNNKPFWKYIKARRNDNIGVAAIRYNGIRVIFCLPMSSSITIHLKSLHWLPVKVRSTYKIACLCYHCHSSTAPSYVTDMLHKKPLHTRNTRSSSYTMPLLNRPAHSKATLGDRSFSFASSSVWNSIPNDVRCAPSLSSFKSRLKTYLFRSA